MACRCRAPVPFDFIGNSRRAHLSCCRKKRAASPSGVHTRQTKIVSVHNFGNQLVADPFGLDVKLLGQHHSRFQKAAPKNMAQLAALAITWANNSNSPTSSSTFAKAFETHSRVYGAALTRIHLLEFRKPQRARLPESASQVITPSPLPPPPLLPAPGRPLAWISAIKAIAVLVKTMR